MTSWRLSQLLKEKTFINTLIPIIYSENLKILNERKKFWIGGENPMEKIFPEIFGLYGCLN